MEIGNYLFGIYFFFLWKLIFICRYWHEKSGIFTTQQMNSLQKSSLAKVLCENGDHIDRIPRNVFLNAMYPRDYVTCSHIEDIDLEPWRGCCNENMAGSNASKIKNFFNDWINILLLLVCNTPAILSFDPFPNYQPQTVDTVTRQKREIIEDNEQKEIEDQKLANDDKLDLEKLRQQVDDVLKKVRIVLFYFLNQLSFFLLVCNFW